MNRCRATQTWMAVLVLGMLGVSHAQATTTDHYLHGTGATANPPTLLLNTTAPTGSTEKYKDSTSINFSGGNLWKEIGTWPTSPIPAAGKLEALTPLHVWLGLKNSDDQGTNFDLLAEVYKNGDLVTSGLTRCITGIVRNQANAKEATVEFPSFTASTLNGTTDTLSVKIWTRIGTNPDNTKCAGHNNAVGLRLYFDATTRNARLGLTLGPPDSTPSSLTPNPLLITVGAAGTLTTTIAPAPQTAGTLTVTSDHSNIAQVPSSVNFAANQTQIPVTVTGIGVGSAQITVSLNGGTASSTVQVNPSVLSVTSLSPATLSLTQGATGTLTVSINATQTTDTLITLTSSDPTSVFVPNSVTVPANQTSATFLVSANTVGSADITASLNGTTAISAVTLTAAPLRIAALKPPTLPITVGSSGTATVVLSATQPSATTIQVAASPSGILTVPATVIVPANQLSVPIPVTGMALGTALVQASVNGLTADTAVQVVPPPPTVESLGPVPPASSPLRVVVGATGQLEITLNAAQTANTPVALTVDNATTLQIPATVPVPANQLHAVFTVTGLATGDAVVTATIGTSTSQATVHVVQPPPTITALEPAALPLQVGAAGSLLLRINAAQPSDTIVALSNTASSVLQAPGTATVPSGQTQVSVPVTAMTTGTATVTATLNATSASSTVTVAQPAPVVAALAPVPPVASPLTLPKGKLGLLRVTLSRAPAATTTVSLSSSAPTVVSVPATEPVPAGALTVDIPVTTPGQGTATITATLNGGSATADVVVTAPQLVTLLIGPAAPSAYIGETIPFAGTGTMTDGTTQDFTTQATWTSTEPTVASIVSTTGVASALAVGTTTIKAVFTPPVGAPIMSETTLTVLTPPALTLSPTSATLQVGQTQDFTVGTEVAPGAGGLLATLSVSGTGTATVSPASVTIAEGQTTATVPVTVTATGLGAATLTASAPIRTPATATLTINPGPPSITSISPTSGPIGTVLTITGTSFNPTAANNQIKINGVTAIVGTVNSTGTTLTTTIPQAATTGAVTVTTLVAPPATGPTFTVVSANFNVTALPTPLTIAAIGQGSFSVGLSGTGGFTNLAALSVTGFPTGMTGQFAIGTIGSGQSSLLTLTTNGTTPTGSYPITITATGSLNGVSTARSTTVNVQVLATGATTFSGQVLDEEDKPVTGALIKIGAIQVATDAAGNFLMQNPPVGADQVLFIDGGPASTPQHSLPIIPYKVTIVAGQANALSFVPHLHFQKTTGMVDISNTGAERIVTDQTLPGFEMRIPAGAQIIGWDGQPNTQYSIRQVPTDRMPLPAPPPQPGFVGGPIYMSYFGKAGGGTPSEPIPVILPNDLGLPPGTQVQHWYFDEAPDGSRPNQWAQYGTGTVSADGSQVLPNIDPNTGKPYGQPRFCCGSRRDVVESQDSGTGAGQEKGADPVDLFTGRFTLEKSDFVLPGRMPILFKRTYRSGGVPGPFGLGTSHSYQILLLRTGNLRTLILEDGRRFIFPLQSDNTFKNLTDASMQGAVITETGAISTLRWKDGATWTFGATDLNTAYLTEQRDRTGNTVAINRGAGVTLIAIIGPDGRQLAIDTDGNGRILKVTDPIGRSMQYAYDGNGRLATVADPEGGTTRYEYDTAGRMTRITDARNNVFLQNFYGPSGRVLRQVQGDGSEYRLRYQLTGATVSGPCTNLTGNIVTVTLPFNACPTVDSWENFQAGYTITGGSVTGTTVVDPRGNTTITRFNARGYRTSVTDAIGQTTTLQLDAANQVVNRTDSLGRTTKFEYDAAGNVKKITDANNQSTQFEYHPTFNRVTKITDALDHVTEFTYDLISGNLLTVKDPLSHVTTISYNNFGQPISVQGPIATEPPTTFVYDANGNLITTTDPLGNATQRVYDAVSRLTSVTDPRGLSAQFRYDGLNRVTEIADARQGITRFTYDANGNLLSVADAKNQTTTYSYNSMDRIATRKDALNRQESYLYDPAGNLSQFTDRKNQQTTFVYDALNRRTTATYPDATTTFAYDSVGRLIKALDTAPGAGTIDYAYDALDRLIQETTGQGTVSYQYDVLGRRTNMVANGQQPVIYDYDAASRLTQVAQGPLVVALGYDNANRRTTLTYPNGTSTSYTYDVASRLTNINHIGPSGIIDALTYQYDAAGNRISLTRSNGSASLLPQSVQAAYDAANEQIQFNSASPNQTFDANGNLQTQADASGTTTFTWDTRNRLIAISGPGLSASFVYDAVGRRVSKTINSITTSYHYDRRDITAEQQGSAVLANYLRKLCLDEAYIRQTATGNEYYHTDALGSVLTLTDQAGTSQVNYSYEPFGKTSITGTSTNPFQYTSRENDGTGLYYYRARYYSPVSQRFVKEDPLRFRAGFNFYAYVDNNPLRYVDPSGLDKEEPRMCELTTARGERIMIPCDVGPNIVPDVVELCRVDYACRNACVADLVGGAVDVCELCRGNTACLTLCSFTSAGGIYTYCTGKCTVCSGGFER